MGFTRSHAAGPATSGFLAALLALGAASAAAGADAVRVPWQESPEAFVVIRSDAPGGIRGFVRAIERAGGHAAVVYAPDAAVVFADDATLAAPTLNPHVAIATRGRVANLQSLGRGERLAVAAEAWNASLEIVAAPPSEPALGEHGPDAGPLPVAPWRGIAPRIEVSDHLPYGADYYDTSAYMAGSTAVGLWLLEAPAASTYHWTAAHETQTIAGVQSGLANWVRKGGPPAFLTFYLDIHIKAPVSGTPIQNSMSMDQTFMNDALSAAGWTGSDAFEKCFAYNNAIRDTFDTNWAYSIAIVESNPNVNQGLFSGGGYAWAYYGGPWVYMARFSTWAFGSATYYAGVPMHETGHIFFDTDEYDSSLQYNGYLNAPDDPGLPQCIMNRNDTTRVCPLTRVQLGWRDTDGNGIIEPLDSPPVTELAAATPDPTPDPTPAWTGSAYVTTVPSMCPYGRYFPQHAITVATVDSVECRVDGGAWLGASPLDGAFDQYSESFAWVAPPLADGMHVVEARALTSVGKWNLDYALDTIVVNSALAVESGALPGFRVYAPRPNPVRDRAEFTLTLPVRLSVDADVIDLAGRRVCRLAAGREFEPGIASLVWNGRDALGNRVPGGVYLARVRAGSETRVQRVIVVP